jgi:nitrogen fixation protein FixH
MRLFQPDKPNELTGRHVLLWLIGFFGLVFIVNAVLVRAATSTFGGLETPSSYRAGLTFEDEIAKAERQQALRWRVDGKLTRDRAGETVLDISVRDAQGQPVTGLTADATLAHPADARLDQIIHLVEGGAGAFHGEAQGHSGQWELIVDFYRDHERVFRSRSRVSLK